MLTVVTLAECHYAERRYAVCPYADCCGTHVYPSVIENRQNLNRFLKDLSISIQKRMFYSILRQRALRSGFRTAKAELHTSNVSAEIGYLFKGLYYKHITIVMTILKVIPQFRVIH